VRLPNWIGDTLMTYPMLLALQSRGVDFVCLGHPWVNALFSGTTLNVVTSAEIKNSKWCYRFYRDHHFDNGILCPKTLSTVSPMRFASIHTTGYHFLCHERLNYNDDAHTVENYFDLAKEFLKEDLAVSAFDSFIPIDDESVVLGQNLIEEKIKEAYVVICPYATNLHKGRNKEWPFWRDFCAKYTGKKIVAVVSESDYARCCSEFPELLVLSNTLAVSAYIMREAEFVLANDSGAMHLASFFGANVIGLFGATEINKTRPWYGSYKVGADNEFISVQDLLKTLL
jgi:heptosyltransferase-2